MYEPVNRNSIFMNTFFFVEVQFMNLVKTKLKTNIFVAFNWLNFNFKSLLKNYKILKNII
jgi:hypothetical protein